MSATFPSSNQYIRPLEDTVKIAVKWWERILNNPTHSFDIKDPTTGPMVEAFATAAYEANKPNEKEHKSFSEVMTNKLMSCVGRCGFVSLESDYRPEGLLSEIFMESDMPMSAAPYKTRMVIYKNGHIEAKCGYGDSMSTITESSVGGI